MLSDGLRRLDTDHAQFSFATPYPGTELYNLAKRRRQLLIDDWSEYTAGRPIIHTGESAAEELPRLLLHAYKSFYLAPRMMLRNLKRGRVSFCLLPSWPSLAHTNFRQGSIKSASYAGLVAHL